MAFLDQFTGDNDYRRAARAEGKAHRAQADAANAQAKIARAQANALEAQQQAEQEAHEQAQEQAFMGKLRALQFSGDVASVSNEMEEIYQIWLANKFDVREDSKKAARKLVEEKLEYGLITLKGLDAAKGSYYEGKITAERNHRKKMFKIKLIGGLAVAAAFVIYFTIYFITNS